MSEPGGGSRAALLPDSAATDRLGRKVVAKGTDADRPRNLAKSVTVE